MSVVERRNCGATAARAGRTVGASHPADRGGAPNAFAPPATVNARLIVGEDGRKRVNIVTERWLRRQELEGNIDPLDPPLVPVHLLGLEGYELTSWVIGEDVTDEAWKRFRDPDTGHLTAMTVVREGRDQTFLVQKDEWSPQERAASVYPIA